jgi:RNA recognition motif-containing protein
MNTLHVTSLPPNTTNQDLRAVFERIGPVLHANVVNDRNGNCLVGVVEMSCAEDVEEILTTKDRISIGGRRPNIWKTTESPTIGQRIKAEYTGVHLEECKGRWYVFEVHDGHLRWCRTLTQHEAATFSRQYLDRSKG